MEELLKNVLEVVGRVARADCRVEFREAVEHPAVEFGHHRRLDALGVGEAVERAKQEAQGIAQAAVTVGGAL